MKFTWSQVSRRVTLLLQLIIAVTAALTYCSVPGVDLRGVDTVVLSEPKMPNAGMEPVQVKLPYFDARLETEKLQAIEFDIVLSGQPALMIEQCRTQPVGAGCVLLIQQVVNGGDYFLNGTWVAGLPKSTPTDRFVWYRPMLIPLPSHLLRTDGGVNVVQVVQSTFEPYIQIPRIYVGMVGPTTLVYEVTLFLSSTLANASNLFCFAAGIFLLGAWLATPKYTSFALAGSATVLWAVLFTVALWPHVPMSLRGYWRWTVYASEAGLILLMSMFVLSVARTALSARARLCVIAFGMSAPVIFALLGSQSEYLLDRLWTGPMLLLYVYATYKLGWYAYEHRDPVARVLLAQSVVCCILGYHDYGVLTGALTSLSPDTPSWQWSSLFFEPIYLTHLGLPILLIVMGYILLGRYQLNVKKVLHANEHLTAALAAREMELNEVHSAQRRSVRMEAAQQERDRIYQDVHDGIGLRLVTTLFSVRSGKAQGLEIETQLQACLTDMRMIINTQQARGEEIQVVVFGFCSDLEAQLERTSLTLLYDICDGPPICFFPHAQVCLIRVLQEAVSNAIKHAKATELVVTLAQSNCELMLTVADNGSGLNDHQAIDLAIEPASSGGMGMPGLAARARALNGSCVVANRSDQSGVVVQLWLPLVSPSCDHLHWPLLKSHLKSNAISDLPKDRVRSEERMRFEARDQFDSGIMPL